MMLRKKAKHGSACDWSTYKENFSDLLEHNETPRRKVKRRSRPIRLGNISSVSQEIHSDSSEDEKVPDSLSEDFGQNSPVLRGVSPTNMHLIKSTPSGSPILQSRRKRSRNPSLIPLSPITPGLKLDFSFPNRSSFSAHLQESKHEQLTLDHTPLALPLDFSDTEIEETHTQAKDATSVILSGDKNVDAIISDSEFSPTKGETEKNNNLCLNTTGSKWIQRVKDKIDAEWNDKASKCAKKDRLGLSYHDSGGKNKFVKGGFAERLTRVLKKENSQKAVFLQRLKTGKIEKQNAESITLKIISDQKEGILHVIECKQINPKHKRSARYYTLLLPDEFVESLNLSLGVKFRLYPPYYKLSLPASPPVLLSAYYISMCEGNSPPGNSENILSNSQLSSPASRCESLLTALEAQPSVEEGISVVATVQRVFCKDISTQSRWSLVCEDAYGTFFNVELGAVATENPWNQVIKHGEGQRIVFKGLSLSNRVTRTQNPKLFSVVDSIWCETGHGLLHVNNSQTDESQTSIASVPLLPPNYCYILHADEISSYRMPVAESDYIPQCGNENSLKNMHSPAHNVDTGSTHNTPTTMGKKTDALTENCQKNKTEDRVCESTISKVGEPSTNCQCAPVYSDLNRPSCDKPLWTDVLYRPSNILTISEAKTSSSSSSIFTVLGKVTKPPNLSSQKSELMPNQFSDDRTFWITDHNAAILEDEEESTICVTATRTCHMLEAIEQYHGLVILKDVCKQNGGILADCYSRVVLPNCMCEVKAILGWQDLQEHVIKFVTSLLGSHDHNCGSVDLL